MYLAEYESSNFTFEAAGKTEKEAIATLMKTIKLHCTRTGARSGDFFCPDEIYTREIQAGWGFIDGGKCGF